MATAEKKYGRIGIHVVAWISLVLFSLVLVWTPGAWAQDAGVNLDSGPDSVLEAGLWDGDIDDAQADDGYETEGGIDDPDASDAEIADESDDLDLAPTRFEPLSLPPVPEAVRSPVVSEAVPRPAPPVAPTERPRVVIKTILGLVALLSLAYIAGHPRVQQIERTLGISQVITAGFPFVVLGSIARLPSVGILTDEVLAQLGPLLRFGLGWIGFIIGFRFDVSKIESAPQGVLSFVSLRAFGSFIVIVVATASLLLGASVLTRESLTDPVFLRDALILGTAGSLTSLTAPDLLAARGGNERSVALVSSIIRFEEVMGILGMLFVAAYFRPAASAASWQIPGTAWLLLTLGLGAAMGILVYAILLRRTTSPAESMVLILGSVAYSAGMAGYLRLSPVVVCFVAGVLLVNFPGHYRERLEQALAHLERPIYLVFLVVVGALWNMADLQGWALMVVFVIARFAGKWVGVQLGRRQSDIELLPDAQSSLVIAPMGALSIAIVVGAEILYPGGSISQIVTAIVGGAIVTEILVQALTRRGRSNGTTIPPGQVRGSSKPPTTPSAPNVAEQPTRPPEGQS
jgi:hypothetical protein